jgi:4-diphosphocytidyl-2-C-methyl-D-erythritol kinase
MKLALAAPAKVNLTLRCLGRRPDGYHEVATTLCALALWDRLLLESHPGAERVALEVAGPFAGIPADATNLAARAAAGVLAHAGARKVDLALRLEKAIPPAAGLGGGSSDAAAAALGSAELLGLAPERWPELLPLLAGLGSDCPFFLAARETGLARCSGRGERVEPGPAARALWALVVTPDLSAPTAAVYAAFRPADARAPEVPEPSNWDALALDEARAALHNDLEPAALRAVPGLAAWRALLDRSDLAHARLAGSGSSFFALYRDGAEAALAARALGAAAERAGLSPRLVRAVPTACAGVRHDSSNSRARA